MADIVQSLFGVTPEMYQQSQQARADQQALQYAQLTPFQQANFAIGRGATMLGGAAGRALGGEDPELARISMRQQIARQINPNQPESIKQGIEALAPNDPQGAMMLQREYQRLLESNALIKQRERERAAADPFQKLVESGKYTPASLADFQVSGKPADLVLYEKPEKPEKPLAPNIKEIGVANQTREPVYLDVNNDLQFIFKQGADGKQVRVPFTGGVDRTTAKTEVGVKLPESQRAEQGERGKALTKDFFENVSPTARNAQKNLPAITSNLNILNKGFETGFGTETAASAAKVLAALGVESAEKFASDSQIFLANANQAVLSKQLEQKGTQTKTDAERIEQTGARLGNTKEANKFILTVAREQLQRDIEQRDFYAKWYKKNTTYDGAEDAWFDGEGGKSLFDRPALKQYGASAASQIPTQSSVPTASQKPIYATNPTTKERIMSIDGGINWTSAR
jgi:hypothetical protein